MSISDSGSPAAGAPGASGAPDLTPGELIGNFVGGADTAPSGDRRLPVRDPATGAQVREVGMSTADDVDAAVEVARAAQLEWAAMPLAARVAVMYDVRNAIRAHLDDLARLIVEENGKTLDDARGEVKRGLESIEYACGLPSNLKGDFSADVARGVDVHSTREPIGVAACITPFNFPVMVPLWMLANALSCGNAVLVKPSEKDPGATVMLAKILTEAGVPAGVLNVVNGDAVAVNALLEHPGVDAVSFVGSTPIARLVYEKGTAAGKRVQALGGAKNHLVVTASADHDAAAAAAVSAAYGAGGERCMAVSVLVAVGDEVADTMIDKIQSLAADVKVGPGLEDGMHFGPLITEQHRDKVAGYLAAGAEAGARIVVDGREHDRFGGEGYFIGPSLVDNVTTDMSVYTDEIFGPVLAVVRVDTVDDAMQLVRDNPFGNGAAIFTGSGAEARRFSTETNIGMIGVNVPIPVPVGWFSFGGWKSSLFGDSHMYGDDGVRFFTRQRVITTRW
ncbi:CoA-acylating methylmalonate-semialdehyde dehydrogenase [Prauserella sp. ASG 168]|uniref:methylmalonate-semialdehyde dehydrogenase (CoA acylating) n=2 Tax=Prauserella cavernicola TaxID=2800127 RepID=A0A934QWN2_9PSEU|nr:CoA-acylating methylmalonate-semialdehyde dehydrogenase [Prauserella cavernicola]